MQISMITEEQQARFASQIPERVWATGPVSYDYHFARRALFDAVVLGSWPTPGSLFAADATTVAVENGQLMGIEIGMPGNEYRLRQHALGSVWQSLVASGDADAEELPVCWSVPRMPAG